VWKDDISLKELNETAQEVENTLSGLIQVRITENSKDDLLNFVYQI